MAKWRNGGMDTFFKAENGISVFYKRNTEKDPARGIGICTKIKVEYGNKKIRRKQNKHSFQAEYDMKNQDISYFFHTPTKKHINHNSRGYTLIAHVDTNVIFINKSIRWQKSCIVLFELNRCFLSIHFFFS